MTGNMSPDVRHYVEAVVRLYVSLPGTPARASRQDRRLARSLYDQRLPLPIVRAALLMAAARRAFRHASAPPLPPIRTLHYFIPVVDEVMHAPLEPGYLDYIATKLRPLAQAKAAALPMLQPSDSFSS